MEDVNGITDHHRSEPLLNYELQATETAGATSVGPGQQRLRFTEQTKCYSLPSPLPLPSSILTIRNDNNRF